MDHESAATKVKKIKWQLLFFSIFEPLGSVRPGGLGHVTASVKLAPFRSSFQEEGSTLKIDIFSDVPM